MSDNLEGIKCPFVWYGGKSRASELIWERLGNVPNFVEPFAGALGVLLNRPHPPGIETVNDLDGFICNVYRALAADPDQVAHYAEWPANESDLHARHVWLKERRATLTAKLEGSPDYYDAKIAGWWLWGISLWIGGNWCSPTIGGPWHVVDGHLVRLETAGYGVSRKRLQLGNSGRGVKRSRLHLGNAGQGVSRQLLHLGDTEESRLVTYCRALQARLRRVRVCCGDWQRIMGPTVLDKLGLTGIVLDPPYDMQDRGAMYAMEDSGSVAAAVRAWAIAHGGNPLLRIVVCSYGNEPCPPGWARVHWKTQGGYANIGHSRGRENASREVLDFSPHCLSAAQPSLF